MEKMQEQEYCVYSGNLFSKWHNDRYFWQCYYNLQEKYDCGGITEEEWQKIKERAREYVKLQRLRAL